MQLSNSRWKGDFEVFKSWLESVVPPGTLSDTPKALIQHMRQLSIKRIFSLGPTSSGDDWNFVDNMFKKLFKIIRLGAITSFNVSLLENICPVPTALDPSSVCLWSSDGATRLRSNSSESSFSTDLYSTLYKICLNDTTPENTRALYKDVLRESHSSYQRIAMHDRTILFITGLFTGFELHGKPHNVQYSSHGKPSVIVLGGKLDAQPVTVRPQPIGGSKIDKPKVTGTEPAASKAKRKAIGSVAPSVSGSASVFTGYSQAKVKSTAFGRPKHSLGYQRNRNITSNCCVKNSTTTVNSVIPRCQDKNKLLFSYPYKDRRVFYPRL
jgi:hypothetical protein